MKILLEVKERGKESDKIIGTAAAETNTLNKATIIGSLLSVLTSYLSQKWRIADIKVTLEK